MKNLKIANLVLILAVIVFLMSSYIVKPENSQSIMTMRVTEVMNGMYDNSISIVYEDGKTENIQLQKLKYKDLHQNLAVINKTVNDLTLKGYTLFSTAQCGGDGMITTTYTFLK